MDRETFRDSQLSYLRAIQKVPGDTAGEKLSWIGRLASRRTSEDLEQLPPELLPLLRVETAVKKKNHEDITSALKSEDLTIINRAFKASWFFDGSHKEIVNVAYFCERLFPYVSVNTRTRIVITLAHRLFGRDPIFAQQMFTAVESTFDVKTAYPLFMACDETFAYETIVEKRLVLPIETVKKIFRKNPNLVVLFLKLLKPAHKKTVCTSFETENFFAIGINRYKSLLPKLIKKRVEDFVELYETHRPDIFLRNTCAELFLKKAKQHVIKEPYTYLKILPLKKINKHLMESMFPGMLPEKKVHFSTNEMLDYLKYYPYDKKYEFLCKSYKNKYNADLLDETRNVTMNLLRMLPFEERINQARIKMEKAQISVKPEYHERAWICYLSVNEAIPVIKKEINKTANKSDRLSLIKQMIYACKINEDDDALSDILMYFLQRHKNESRDVFEGLFDILMKIYNIPHLNVKQVSLIMEIVRLFYVKNAFTPNDILTDMVHFRLIHNMPIEDLINMFLENRYITFDIFPEYPQYARQCLVTFAKLFQKQSFKDSNISERRKLCHFVGAMYDFNYSLENSDIKIEKLTIRDYPWLMDAILEIISPEEKCPSKSIHDVLYLYEPELYRSWFKSDRVLPADEEESEESQDYIANEVTSGAALALLKRDLPSILDNWEKYLEDSMKKYYHKRVQHFIRTMRWYKDLPVKFAECCMDYVYEKHKDRISSGMGILANLLHGDAMTKLIDPFIPTETNIDTSHPNAKDNYEIVKNLSLSMRLSNPPVPLDLIIRLCEGDYLSIALMTLSNVSRRTSLPKVISTAQKLTSMRVSVRKHGIRLISLFSERELIDFYQERWSIEKHYSIRQVLFEEIQRLFLTDQRLETWSLYYQTVSTLNLDEEALFSKMIPLSDISNKYIIKYLDLQLKMIDKFQEMGLKIEKIKEYTIQYLKMILDSFNFLTEELIENLLRRYLFHPFISDIYDKMISICLQYIFSEDKYEARFKVFADIFRNAVTSHRNKRSQPSFIKDYIEYVSKYFFCNMNNSINPQVIDNMLILFSSIWLPVQDAESYLLLVYAKKFQECKESSNMKSFGLKIGQHLPELIDIFSSLFVSFMAEVLEYLFQIFQNSYDCIKYEELKLSTIEGLIEAGNTESCFIAVKILPSKTKWLTEHIARYNQLIEKFREMQDPAITTILYDCNFVQF